MSFQGDPYRTLGVTPGASLNEIKSAYRRLAKQYHPDAAGERALPRFLAIQAAYERLVDGEGRLRPTTPSARGPAPRPQAGWRADPSRARASRDAWRARRTGGSAGSTARDGTGASTPGAGPGGSTDGRTAGPRESTRRDRPSREHHARRGPRKATPGSTTYDEAAEVPLDPEWDGGAWYGPSSGTYWTINPREYADPRKHGPEYLARAWRAARAERGAPEAPPLAGDHDADAWTDPDADTVRGPGPSSQTDAADETPSWQWDGPDATTTDGGAEWGTRAWRYDGTAPWAAPGEHRPAGARSAGATPPSATSSAAAEPLPDLESLVRRFAPRNLLALARRPARRWRLVLAFAGWPPIGYAVGTLAAELTGCAAYSPACAESLQVLPIVLQPLVIGGLFLVPPAAAVAAFAAFAAFAVALPMAAVLSVGSMPESRALAPVLGVVVAVAYLVALVAGISSVWRAPDRGGERSSEP